MAHDLLKESLAVLVVIQSTSKKTYLLFLPLRESVADELNVWVNVDARADDEYPAESLDNENSLPSWKSLFLNAS